MSLLPQNRISPKRWPYGARPQNKGGHGHGHGHKHKKRNSHKDTDTLTEKIHQPSQHLASVPRWLSRVLPWLALSPTHTSLAAAHNNERTLHHPPRSNAAVTPHLTRKRGQASTHRRCSHGFWSYCWLIDGGPRVFGT